MSVLVIVPARGGSRGLPGKNLLPVAGISLVGRAVRAGRRFLRDTGLAGRVVVDTDAQAIADEGVRYGADVPFLRPPALAADDTPTIDSVLHLLDRLEPGDGGHDVVVLLQPTSPLRSVSDVVACHAALQGSSGSVVAVVESAHPPQQALSLAADGTVAWAFPGERPDRRRQSLGATWRPSGAVYACTVAWLRRHRAFVVPGITRAVVLPPARSVDVDTADDLALARALARADLPAPVRIAGRLVGPGEPCFVIAEAGVNHEGRVDLAHRLVDAAADAGADAVKFQTFDPDLLVSPAAAMADYQAANTGRRITQAEMLRELVLPREAHAELLAHAAERGLVFLSSPFDEGSADFLVALGVPAIKLGSGELTNHPLLAHVGGYGLPVVLSTGMADIAEVAAAVDVLAASGDPPLVLTHCVSSYPAPAADTNLLAVDTLRTAFGVPAGLSDHSEGIEIAVAAVALGAAVVEKHYTLDRTLPGPDHKASLEPDALAAMMRAIRSVESARGDGVKSPRPVESGLRRIARKSLHAARDLGAGHVLCRSDLLALRPDDGLPPSRLDAVLGRRLRRGLAAGSALKEGDLE